MESVCLRTAAQQLRVKKGQVEACLAKLKLEVNFKAIGFYDDLLQRVDILALTEGSPLNSGFCFQQEITNATTFYQIPLLNEINEAFNLQGIFPFAGQISLNISQAVSSAILMENSLQVMGEKLLQKKAQVEAGLRSLQMEVSFNLTRFYEYLIQRVDILALTGTASIPDPVSYLQAEIVQASAQYQTRLVMAVNEAFNLQAFFTMEKTQQQTVVNQTDTFCSAAASTSTENDANLGTDDLLGDDDLEHDFFNDPEDNMHADEVSTHESQGDNQVSAEQQSVPSEDNTSRRPSVSIKSEVMDDNSLADVHCQPPANYVIDSGSIVKQEENYLEHNDDESPLEDALVEEVSAHLQKQEVTMSGEEDEEASFVDERNNSHEDTILDQTNVDDDAENLSDLEENSMLEDDEESDYSVDDSRDDPNYEEDDEEEERAVLGVAGPSSRTLRQSTRHSARVSKASSDQEDQTIRGVSKHQTGARRSSNEGREETEPPTIIAKNLLCTVPGCKKKKKFSDKDALNRHLLSAHNLKKYRCLVRRCYGKVSTSFTTQAQFTNHLDRVHDNHLRKGHGRTTRLACHCSKKFDSYEELRSHYWKYHQLGQFACSKDGCAFKPSSIRSKVYDHLRNHREAKYECSVDGCGKSFKRKEHLDKHTLTHTGERPFPCTKCAKSFIQKGNLTAHLRIHRNDKCYRCTWPQCTHSATSRSSVIKHIRTVHFELPKTKRQQAEEEIEDDRSPGDYLARD